MAGKKNCALLIVLVKFKLEITYIGEAACANLTLASVTVSSLDFVLKRCSGGQSFALEGSICHNWFAQKKVEFDKNLLRGLSM